MHHKQEWKGFPSIRKPKVSEVLRARTIFNPLIEGRRWPRQDVAQGTSRGTRRFQLYKLEEDLGSISSG
jgi:hypothetical protein